MNIYQKLFLTFYAANYSLKNRQAISDEEILDSALMTILLFTALYVGLFEGVINYYLSVFYPQIGIYIRSHASIIPISIFFIPIFFLYYTQLKFEKKYIQIIEKSKVEVVNWKKNLLVFVFVTIIYIAIVLILLAF